MSGRRSRPSLVLRARHVLPMVGPPLENGWVRISGGRIQAIGRARTAGETLDLGDAILMPGLVNAHTHLEFSGLEQPLDTGGGLPAWIGRVVAARRERAAHPDGDAVASAAIRRGCAESAAAGVTAIGEIATLTDPAGYRAAGPRIRVFREAIGLSPPTMTAAARAVTRDLDRLVSAGVDCGISPHAPYTVAAPLGSRLLDLGRARGLPAAMHVAESVAEDELLRLGTGPFRDLLEEFGAWQPENPPRLLSPVDWISRLARLPRGIVVHATHLDRDPSAMARLARHRDRLCVAICPRTTLALSGTLPPLRHFREAGLRVAIGTDSRASSPDLSVLAECRTLVDAGLVTPATALTMATLHGAWALMMDRRCGSLVPGRAADLVILRPESRHDDPSAAALDPATRIVATLRGGRVIAGRLDGDRPVSPSPTADSSRSASR